MDLEREHLTERELEVAALISQDLTNEQIADRLTISPETVKSHVARVLRKLGLRSRFQVADWYRSQQVHSLGDGVSNERRRRWRGRDWRGGDMRVSFISGGLVALAAAALAWNVLVSDAAPRRDADPRPALVATDASGTPEPIELFAAPPVPSSDSHTIPAPELPVLLRDASVAERAMIEDGVITRAEMEQAFDAAYQCTVAAAEAIGGVTLRPPVPGSDGLPVWGGASSPEHDRLNALATANNDCIERFYNHVYAAWGMEVAYQRVQPIWNAIASCLQDKGYSPPANPTLRQLGEAVYDASGGDMRDFQSCAAAAERKHSGG